MRCASQVRGSSATDLFCFGFLHQILPRDASLESEDLTEEEPGQN